MAEQDRRHLPDCGKFRHPGGAGSLLADATEVLGVSVWGTQYIAPISQNTSSTTNAFEYAAFLSMASQNGTEIQAQRRAQNNPQSR